jgi:hypothetical protein
MWLALCAVTKISFAASTNFDHGNQKSDTNRAARHLGLSASIPARDTAPFAGGTRSRVLPNYLSFSKRGVTRGFTVNTEPPSSKVPKLERRREETYEKSRVSQFATIEHPRLKESVFRRFL